MLDTLMNAFDAHTPLRDLLDDTQIQTILRDPNPEIRSWLAKALVFDAGYPAAAEWLSHLARDEDPDVRVEAVDSLSQFPYTLTHETLRAALDDTDPLVRAYAAFGLAWTKAADAAALLSTALEREIENAVRVQILEGLYLLGHHKAMADLIDLFFDEDYHVQCGVLHALEEIENPENTAQIHAFLTSLRPDDYPRAVASTLENMQKK